MNGAHDLRATITLTHQEWSGWDPEGYPITTWAKLRVAKGKVLSPKTVQREEPEGSGFPALKYEVIVERIVADRVGFFFRRLVIKNPGGGLNLTIPDFGRFILRCGEKVEMGTPTMDIGISVSLELHEIG